MNTRCLGLLGVAVLFPAVLVAGPADPDRTFPQPVTQASPQPRSVRAGGLEDRADLEAFLDGVIAAQRESNHIVGATVAVVADGEVFFAKGYGPADLATGRQVDPARTLFRIGSVSKLFTWTAVMQLVEQGKLDPAADVNRYLAGSPIHVPDTFPQPVTMLSLMTHTPGFEDSVIGLFARSPEAMRPLGEVLAGQLPARVRPPGVLSSYSNHGTALAGYVVERIARVPWERYVEENILAPLRMTHTTVRQPIPAALAGDMSRGYRLVDGEPHAEPFEFVPPAPAGAVSASAVDMAHFMIAHLQDGRFEGARILSEATAREMHTRLFGPVRELNGMMRGFYEMTRNGHRIFGHGGDTLWFHTELALLPDDHAGIFVSYNSDSGAPARTAICQAFIDRYFPAAPAAAPAPTARLREPAGTFAGTYRSVRLSYSSLTKLMGLMSVVKVRELPGAGLSTDGLGSGHKRWVEIAPLVFREANGQDRLAFRRDASGRVSSLLGSFPAATYERLGPLETPEVHYAALGLSLCILLLAAIGWPIGAWRGRRQRQPGDPPRAARLVLWIAAVLLIASTVGLGISLSDAEQIAFGIPTSLEVVLALPMLGAVATAVALVFVVRAWSKGYWRLAARLRYTLVAAAAVAFLVVLNYWNVLGYRFH